MKRNITIILFSILSVCAILLGGCGAPDRAITFTTDEEKLSEGAETKNEIGLPVENSVNENGKAVQGHIYVYVCGAVENPGVYELEAGSRVIEALSAAGGFARDADENYVNLAAELTDGQKLEFPTVDEARDARNMEEEEKSSLVNINTADISRLMTLTGIGESRAKDIIAYRDKNGGFSAKEDIMKVSGIKQNTYDKIADMITVD